MILGGITQSQPDVRCAFVCAAGWGAKYDEWIDSRPDAGLLAQRGTHTKRAKVTCHVILPENQCPRADATPHARTRTHALCLTGVQRWLPACASGA
jgi:hypothetical protein